MKTKQLPRDWREESFEKCLEKIKYPLKIHKKEFLTEGSFPIISQEKKFINGYWNNEDNLFQIKKPVIIFGDHTQVIKYVDFDFVLGADGVKIIEPIGKINSKFLYYFLKSVKIKGLGYARHYRLLKEKLIPIPPLQTQKQIVKILDQAFKEIAKSEENAEKNLKNTKELFESYLEEIFSNPEEDWEEKKLGEVLKLEYGKPLDKKDRTSAGKYPVYGANGEKSRSNKFYYDKKSIIVGRKGSAGEVNLTKEKFWPLDVTYFVTFDSKKYDLIFLYYLLKKLHIPSLAKGVKPGINRNEVYSIEKYFPPLPQQKQIVQKLDALSKETKELETIYKHKIKNLDELKKSVLKKAFAGELTC